MRLPAPFFACGEHLAIELPGARALFTTRRGGYSRGPYASLNLGRWTDDEPAAVQRNREAVQDDLGSRFAYGRQVHGTAIELAGTATKQPAEADGQVTVTRGVAPMVLTADCLPIALAGGGVVAMLHAGWRGLVGGIVARGVDALRGLAGGAPLAAAIGPGAGHCCYEVSEEVHARFAARAADLRRGTKLDLKVIARVELERAGVGEIHDLGLCTICAEPSLFFSHRRDGGKTGRQGGVAWLT